MWEIIGLTFISTTVQVYVGDYGFDPYFYDCPDICRNCSNQLYGILILLFILFLRMKADFILFLRMKADFILFLRTKVDFILFLRMKADFILFLRMKADFILFLRMKADFILFLRMKADFINSLSITHTIH
jgi:hypothetical protein